VNIAIAKRFFENGKSRFASTMNRRDIAHAQSVTQQNGYAGDLVILRGQ
jgi:hypothetical protein